MRTIFELPKPWLTFDERRGAKAKAANEVEGETEIEGMGLFNAGAGSVAAE